MNLLNGVSTQRTAATVRAAAAFSSAASLARIGVSLITGASARNGRVRSYAGHNIYRIAKNHGPEARTVRPISSKRLMTTAPLVDKLARKLPNVSVTAYDGCTSGPASANCTIELNSPAALAQILRAPRGLGLARAWVTGQIDVQGDWYSLIRHEDTLRDPGLIFTTLSTAIRIAPTLRLRDIKATGPTSIEFQKNRPGAHTIGRDTECCEFHYGLQPEFYRYLLGPSLTYSCAIFLDESDTLETAQDNKHRLICDKLKLDSSSVILDLGCGWGSFIRYATCGYGCSAVGVTASRAQYAEAQKLKAEPAGPRIRVVCNDYRQALPMKGITAAASIGMYEHVGEKNSPKLFRLVRSCLKPGSLYLNQAIIIREDGPRRFRRNSFAQRYIFPNAQVLPLTRQLDDLRSADFSIKSVDRHGRSYALTIRQWLRNLETNWGACVRLEGEQRVRAWYIYLMGAMARFESKAIDLVQVTAEAK